ncbi:MAG: thermonuclease family protein [Candidatus Levybacteria bacterium]|nr:thermonuclease family protein [Candidatus Levybacteria bacterium]
MKRHWKLFSFVLVILFLAFVSVINSKSKSEQSPPTKETRGISTSLSPTSVPFVSITNSPQFVEKELGFEVVKVIDGDTLDVEMDGRKETLRLIGIDTPETVDPRKSVQCFGKEASEFTRNMLLGKFVLLEADPTQGERDKYGRLLRYVFLEDDNFNEILIREGFAHEYTYSLSYKYQKEFKDAQNFAQENKKGLWADNACDSSSLKQTEATYEPQGTYSCNCQKSCTQITNCDEAYYQLQKCGCSVRDSDGDGIPCESLCR